MQRQLGGIVKGFERAQARLEKLADNVPDAAWGERTEPGRWSVAECVAHLNLTSAAYIPRIQAALAEAKAMHVPKSTKYSQDFMGKLFALMVGPLPTFGKMRIGRVKTARDFVPAGAPPKQSTLSAFKKYQDELIALVHEGDGLPLDKVKIKSPFGGRISYNCYSALVILTRHEQRHLDQARMVWSSGRNDVPA